MNRATLHVALALAAAASITWAIVATVRADTEPAFGLITQQGGALLFLLAIHVGFSKCVELKGGISVVGLIVGVGFWTTLLLPGLTGSICTPGAWRLDSAYRFGTVFPAFLLGKFLFFALRSPTPGDPEIPTATVR